MIKQGTVERINKVSYFPSLYEIQNISLQGTAYLHRTILSMRIKIIIKITPKRGNKKGKSCIYSLIIKRWNKNLRGISTNSCTK